MSSLKSFKSGIFRRSLCRESPRGNQTPSLRSISRILSLPPGALDMLDVMQLLAKGAILRGVYNGEEVSRLARAVTGGHDESQMPV